MPPSLSCPDCGDEYADRWRCECGAVLDFTAPPVPDLDSFAPADADPRRGLWAFAPFLPVAPRVTLGEGFSPLVEAPGWDATFKLEYVAPTGSFKDRGATATLSRAAGLGVDGVVEDSSGNAGAAVATYAARGGIDCRIFVPADVKPGKVRAIERAGAAVEPVEGSREDVTTACIERVERGDAWYASHAWRPSFLEGTATFAYEVAVQNAAGPDVEPPLSVPDAVVVPVGHGTLLLGAARGFERLRVAGWTDRVPRLLGVQAAGYDPIARAFGNAGEGTNDRADGIRVREPVRREAVVDALERTGGDCIAVGADAVERELDALGRAGFYTEPTCAVAPAALRAYRERGTLDDGADVVVPLTGSGLKS
jgi:threonine synthase